jgi:CRISPR-associated endonuclease Csn1
MAGMRYRLALDLGSTSLGWAMVRLGADNAPCAVIKAGSRIFSDGRNPKDGSSLAVTRRDARAMRRRRDRLLKRKARMMRTLIAHGFFPNEANERKELETLDPYELRSRGLQSALTGPEFARALFQINQRRGFKSNRKTDKKDNDSGALKTAINTLRAALKSDNCATVGQWLYQRHLAGHTVRARFRQNKVIKDDGKTRIDKSYDLYIDRAMIEDEFDALWAKQTELNPTLFTDTARAELKDCLLHQRPLKPVKPGRCTLLPDEERASLALPSTQRFRIYQEVNNLRILREGLKEEILTLAQRNELVQALEENSKRSFTQIKKLLGLSGAVKFNIEDSKRTELKGNTTSAILGGKANFGSAWFNFDEVRQDAIVLQLVREENEAKLIVWLQAETGVDERRAEDIANQGLPEGYGSLSAMALSRILPELRRDVVTYDKAVLAAGFSHHSQLPYAAGPDDGEEIESIDLDTGEIKKKFRFYQLPYYGKPLQRHVGFGTGDPADTPEKRFGKIANPTVHIGLNQVRLVVNALIKRYGHPSEVIVEVARDLKQSQEQRKEENERQANNQKRNERIRADVAGVLQISIERVKATDIQKVILWEELSFDPAFRHCPYSGMQISEAMLLSDQVEIEHILPFSETLDDSLNNKTVALRTANRVKGNLTPWQAFGAQSNTGFNYAEILQRAEQMPMQKRYRFAEDGYQRWLRDDKGFLARALNDTRYLSRVAREYVSLICPQNTRVIPGRMTAMLRAKFGLNDVLGTNGIKNRNDHRHHAVDACVIAVTDQGLLQRFAKASASAREQHLNRLVETMPDPWPTYRQHVQRAVNNIWVSHKPDHSHEGAMHNDTAYALLGNGRVSVRKTVDGVRTRVEDNLKVIEFSNAKTPERHGLLLNGEPRPYKGYKGDSNYCIEIARNEKGKWEGEVISTFEAYQLVRQFESQKEGVSRLRHSSLSLSEKSLIMRLVIDDFIRLEIDDVLRSMRVASINSAGRLTLADHQEANVDARNRDTAGEWRYTYKQAGSLRSARARKISISPIGELNDPGFKE